uniref:histone acetyltransferase n=2 Tax=Kalmanozyma brasiliensis (strain GHG001) TaxID=1365824 RepID=V5ET61_KALBG
MLWICDGCFKYMKTYNGFAAHRKFCRNTHPPGRKVYQRGAHIIWEVDGAAEKLYCQNLSLFGKLFIDHKTIYFDVEPFMFYVLTDAANASFDHPLGFFSKEKVSYDDYNLACIVTFPPFQRKSFGTLMIEFSYYLSAAQGMLGTPERPLSDLGFKGYLSFWTAVLLRALHCCFDGPLRRVNGTSTTRQRGPSSPVKPAIDASVQDSKVNAEDALRRWHMLSQRCKLLGVSLESISHQAGFVELQQLAAEADTSDAITNPGPSAGSHRRKLRLKGWAGSVPNRSPRQRGGQNGVSESAAEGEGATRRSSRSAANGSAASAAGQDAPVHPALDLQKLQEEEDATCTIAVTVDSLSRLTHLRADDIVLALSEAGLLDAPDMPFLHATDDAVQLNGASNLNGSSEAKPANGEAASNNQSLALLLTRDAIREVIARFNVRPAVLDESYALI